MEKLTTTTTTTTLFTPLFQNSSIRRLPKTINSLALGVDADASTGTPLSVSFSSLPYHNSPFPDYLDDPGKITSLNLAKQMHAQLVKLPNVGVVDDAIVKNLMTCYLRFYDFESAVMVFFVGFRRNFMFWRWFLEEFRSFGGDPVEILEVFAELHGKGVRFDSRILTVVLKLSAVLRDKWLGVEVHGCLFKRGFDLDVHLRCALMNFYGRCWGADYAHKMFDEMPEPDVSLWNEAIVAALQNESPMKALELFQDMQFSLVKGDSFTIAKALQACGKGGADVEGRQLHGYVFRNCMEGELPICNALINMYTKTHNIELARRVFDSIENGNLSTWNSMISGYASLGCFDDALELFNQMERHNMQPDVVTWNCLLSSHFDYGLFRQVLSLLHDMLVANSKPNSSSITPAIQAVCELNLVRLGKEIHGFVLRNGLDYDEYVLTTLLDMYVKAGETDKAQSVFDLMKTDNIITWNSLIAGYSSKGLFDAAEKLLHQMEVEGIKPDIVTWNCMLSGYSQNGREKDALAVIEKIRALGESPNVVSWTALISGCSQNEKYKESLDFFNRMLEEGVKPNTVTLSSLLQACAGLSWLQKGKEIHCWCIRTGFDEDVVVATALIHMYIKSGSLVFASEIFSRMKNKTVATWNCMIMGFAVYNQGTQGIALFNKMRDVGVPPDAITFTALLSCCKNSGLLDQGWEFFDSMKADYNIEPTIEHYSCMVDLLGRAGFLDEAWDFIHTMPVKPDASVWGSLLQSCRLHNNLNLGRFAAKNLFELEPNNSANYVILMNLYSMSGRWDDVERVREQMSSQGVRIQLGLSWIQINHDKVHVFSEEEAHPDIGNIYFELYQLVSEMKEAGYVPDVKCVYQEMEDVEKEKVLLTHTEKLAITYGLMNSKNGSPIWIVKSTRMCSDCHTAAKFMSLVRDREIILKDGVRFHHFRQGRCSCNDYW